MGIILIHFIVLKLFSRAVQDLFVVFDRALRTIGYKRAVKDSGIIFDRISRTLTERTILP